MSQNEQDFIVLLNGLQRVFTPITCIISIAGRSKRTLTCIRKGYKFVTTIDFDDANMSEHFTALTNEIQKERNVDGTETATDSDAKTVVEAFRQ